MKSNYGNFVMQKALKLASNLTRNKLIELMSNEIDKLGDFKLISKWKEIIYSLTDKIDSKNLYIRNSSLDQFFRCIDNSD